MHTSNEFPKEIIIILIYDDYITKVITFTVEGST